MATWDQGINSGGLLAGIGGQNTNAPSAGDVLPTLGLIRENNEFNRAGGNNLGLQLMQGGASLSKEMRQQDFNEKWGQARASGNTGDMRKLFADYPEMAEQIGQGMSGISTDTRETLGNLASTARIAAQSPESMRKWLTENAGELSRIGASPDEVASLYQKNPSEFADLADHLGLAAVGPENYFNIIDKQQARSIQREGLTETIRSNKASEGLQARGQNITARGQDISAATARRGQDLSLERANLANGNSGERLVQLSDGRTATVSGKLHGAGASAFYEGIDNAGNMVRVPASVIAAPPSSAATAQKYAMKKDIDSIIDATPEQLGFMTGMTGGVGSPAVGADYKSRWNGKEQRQMFTSAQRIQGRMQNQGVAAAKDMGASGINTVAEAKMYFQSMPQIDYSSPEALQASLKNIRDYTNDYNQQYKVNVGQNDSSVSRTATPHSNAEPNQGGYQNLWGD